MCLNMLNEHSRINRMFNCDLFDSVQRFCAWKLYVLNLGVKVFQKKFEIGVLISTLFKQCLARSLRFNEVYITSV